MKEPIAIINSIAEFARAILPAAVALGAFALDEKQLATWIIIINVTVTFAASLFARSKVTPATKESAVKK